ncbi:hypothetical protein BJ875DRAFT_484705 [Amylocarpus encephaloides]|uniref:Uncharacterized protein n=1 Tax=Amylocarpus encephaloides TaxID=45428 RepID=A0A9P8C565_9HELO|nr:hypothetical protein BJ875DRAFT_484705 [Amylocarpus encephaloides]
MSSASVSKPQRQTQLSRKKAWERAHLRYPFWFGGSASCFAACVTHPLDLVKVTAPLPRPTLSTALQTNN